MFRIKLLSILLGISLVRLGGATDSPLLAPVPDSDWGDLPPPRPALCIYQETNALLLEGDDGTSSTCKTFVNDTITAQEGLAFVGQPVYYQGPNQNCFQGTLFGGPEKFHATYAPFNKTCEANLGTHQLCMGRCGGRLGPGYCVNTTIRTSAGGVTCEDQSDPYPQAVITYPDTTCGAEFAASHSYSYQNDLGACFAVNCVTVRNTAIEVHEGATCAQLLAPARTVQRCFNRPCGSSSSSTTTTIETGTTATKGGGRNRRTRSLRAAQQLHPAPMAAHLEARAAACGQFQYQTSLVVDNHLFAVATLLQEGNNKDATAAAAANCPAVVMTEAEFPQAGQPYRKRIHVWDTPSQADYFLDEASSLPMGTFSLAELYEAYQSIDPAAKSKSNKNKNKHKLLLGGYDVIQNNCADYLLDLAGALGVPVNTARVTSFVARRLVQQSGRALVDQIRRSTQYKSLLLRQRLLSGHDHDQQQPDNNKNNNDNQQHHHLRAAKQEELSDQQLIELLVDTRAANLI